MNLTITTSTPALHAVHVLPECALPSGSPVSGVILTLTSPEAILAAARSAARERVDWVVHGPALPGHESDSVAFLLTLARALRGRLWVVLDPTRGSHVRIAGHLLRAGCGADPTWVSL